ncbi:MAG: hypothetical protein JXR70_14425 [Spirochaetales bacterium]|nr:hypothetical protein [Spirochaetales bacterium]
MLITLYKMDGEKQFFYSINDHHRSLFSQKILNCVWGIRNHRAKEKNYFFETENELFAKVMELCRKQQAKGYQLLYVYPRDLLTPSNLTA